MIKIWVVAYKVRWNLSTFIFVSWGVVVLLQVENLNSCLCAHKVVYAANWKISPTKLCLFDEFSPIQPSSIKSNNLGIFGNCVPIVEDESVCQTASISLHTCLRHENCVCVCVCVALFLFALKLINESVLAFVYTMVHFSS